MEISDKNPVQINSYVHQVQQNAVSSKAPQGKEGAKPGEDSVELSQTAKDLKLAQAALRDLPDIRSEKVAGLKQQIDDGTYEIKPRKIAGKMIEESLINKLP
jgi:negative regulator of flagellin synthesis FlgM